MHCGIDVIEVERIKMAIEKSEKFKNNIFTKTEIEEIDKCSAKLKYQRYAGRFAAKEAVFKAISKVLCENNLTLELGKIEIINEKNLKNRPKVNIIDDSVNKALSDYDIDVSITHIESLAMAEAIMYKV